MNKIIFSKLFFLSLIVISFASSCKKDEDPTRTELLTNKPWKITAQVVNPGIDFGNGTVITNIYDLISDCDKDNTNKFNTDKTMLYDAGALKCSANEPQSVVSGTWSLNSDETIISITEDGDTFNATILELNDNTFKISFSEVLDNINYTTTTTYTH